MNISKEKRSSKSATANEWDRRCSTRGTERAPARLNSMARMLPVVVLVRVLAMLPLQAGGTDVDWPQGAGPRGDWSAEGVAPPLRFSVRTGENLRWRTPLPETGQGGIAVVGRRVYVATMAPWEEAEPRAAALSERYAQATEGRRVIGTDIDAHALDAESGKLLWTRRITGTVPAIYSYPFSDATSASPVADAEHVWFTNAAGALVCFTPEGETVWERRFTPTSEGPFNKQFEPFLVHDAGRSVLVHMEPFPAPGADPTAPGGRWHHLVGLDGASGKVLWRSADALTHYNAPTLVTTARGPHLLHARGGPHDVPERPVGVTLTILCGPRAGEAAWRYEDPRGNHEGALQTMAHDERFAYWALRDPRSALVVLDLATGKEVAEISLVRGVTVTSRDPASGAWASRTDVALELGVFPARYSLSAAHGHVFFQCYAAAFGAPTVGPAYSFARVDPVARRVEYLEVPTDVVRGTPDTYLWRTPRAARATNSRGREVTGDERSRWDGWDWVFNGSPTRVNERLHFTLASGLVYVLDARRETFDAGALLALDDLGPSGEVWSASSVSYAAGRLYHRTASEILCFAERR
jgi:putative pyrroloquinoline-quinone binding quinoprotein